MFGNSSSLSSSLSTSTSSTLLSHDQKDRPLSKSTSQKFDPDEDASNNNFGSEKNAFNIPNSSMYVSSIAPPLTPQKGDRDNSWELPSSRRALFPSCTESVTEEDYFLRKIALGRELEQALEIKKLSEQQAEMSKALVDRENEIKKLRKDLIEEKTEEIKKLSEQQTEMSKALVDQENEIKKLKKDLIKQKAEIEKLKIGFQDQATRREQEKTESAEQQSPEAKLLPPKNSRYQEEKITEKDKVTKSVQEIKSQSGAEVYCYLSVSVSVEKSEEREDKLKLFGKCLSTKMGIEIYGEAKNAKSTTAFARASSKACNEMRLYLDRKKKAKDEVEKIFGVVKCRVRKLDGRSEQKLPVFAKNNESISHVLWFQPIQKIVNTTNDLKEPNQSNLQSNIRDIEYGVCYNFLEESSLLPQEEKEKLPPITLPSMSKECEELLKIYDINHLINDLREYTDKDKDDENKPCWAGFFTSYWKETIRIKKTKLKFLQDLRNEYYKNIRQDDSKTCDEKKKNILNKLASEYKSKGYDLALMTDDIENKIRNRQFEPEEYTLYIKSEVDGFTYFANGMDESKKIAKNELESKNLNTAKLDDLNKIKDQILTKTGHTKRRNALNTVAAGFFSGRNLLSGTPKLSSRTLNLMNELGYDSQVSNSNSSRK